MDRREALTFLGSTAAAFAALNSGAVRGKEKQQSEQSHEHGGHFALCAKVCAECMSSCAGCYHHCGALVMAGKHEHAETMNLCLDCADLCGVAANLASRNGPLSKVVCEACAKACDECGAACEKFSDDKHMTECAAICKKCAAACQVMIEHLRSS